MSKALDGGFARVRFVLPALVAAALLFALPSSSVASSDGESQCMIEPWYCDPGEEPCMIEPWECGPEEPCMIEPWECGEEEPVICVNGLGRYIVVFHDWVQDPESLARAQVEQYGGELGFIYKYALKGYSAGYTKQAVAAVRNEPTVNYVSVDGIVTTAGDSSEAAGCVTLEPESADPGSGTANAGSLNPSAADSTSASVKLCGKAKVRRAGNCVRKRALARRACNKRAGVAKFRCGRRAAR